MNRISSVPSWLCLALVLSAGCGNESHADRPRTEPPGRPVLVTPSGRPSGGTVENPGESELNLPIGGDDVDSLLAAYFVLHAYPDLPSKVQLIVDRAGEPGRPPAELPQVEVVLHGDAGSTTVVGGRVSTWREGIAEMQGG